MEIQTYLKIIIRRWWIILLVTLAVGAASVYFSPQFPPKYQAEANLRVVTSLGGSLGDISYQTYYADRLMNTYAQIAASEQVMNEVKAKLKLSKLPDISVKTVPNSEIINISVTGSDPKLVAETANTLASAIISMSQENARSDNTSSQDLNILTDRQASLQKDLEQARQDRDKLVNEYATITAQLDTLDRDIQLKEASYKSLQDQYQQAAVNEAVATYASTKVPAKTEKNMMGDQISALDTQLSNLRKQYQDLLSSSITYSQQITSANQSVQNKESAYQNLLTQIDTAKIANSKLESAQDVMIASPAIAPLKPTGPGKALIIGLGFICGLIVGVLLAFLINTLDTRLLSEDQIRQMTQLPVLGRLPNLSRKDRKAPWESNDIKVQRAFGTLCTKIHTLQKSRSVKTILLMSANSSEGKSTIVQALAVGMAKANRKVLVVDADLRKNEHGLLEQFHLSGDEHGLASYLRGESSLSDTIKTLQSPGVYFLPSGIEEDDPTALFHTPAFTELLEKSAGYDIVLFDSPAMLAVTDAYDLAMLVDGIILITQRKRTRVEDIQAVLNQLEDVQDKLMGTIINRVPRKRISGDYRYSRKSSRLSDTSIRLPGVSKPGTM